MTEAIDTAALDAWVCEHLLGWKWWVHREGTNSMHPGQRFLVSDFDRAEDRAYWEKLARPANGDEPIAPPTDPFPRLSTTGDGRAMVEAAMIERGYSLCLHIFKDLTYVDVFRPQAGAPFQIPVPVVEDIEASDTDMAVALAAQAALEAEA